MTRVQPSAHVPVLKIHHFSDSISIATGEFLIMMTFKTAATSLIISPKPRRLITYSYVVQK